MILYIWAIGIIFTISVFAIKVGLGLGIYPTGIKRKTLLLFLYLALFWGMGVLVQEVNLLDYFSFFQKFLSHGMAVHTFLALGMILWGTYLLNRKDYELCEKERQKTIPGKSVWLVLLPCPVCLTAILVSVSVGMAISGLNGLLVGMILGLIFVLVAGFTILSCRWRLRDSKTESEQRLGLLMLGIGAYFFMAVLIMPAYLEAKKIYNLAINQTNQSYDLRGTGVFILLVIFFLALGFTQKKRELKK